MIIRISLKNKIVKLADISDPDAYAATSFTFKSYEDTARRIDLFSGADVDIWDIELFATRSMNAIDLEGISCCLGLL
jgi:hypothetical protein